VIRDDDMMTDDNFIIRYGLLIGIIGNENTNVESLIRN
jgi:hypothetical protein